MTSAAIPIGISITGTASLAALHDHLARHHLAQRHRLRQHHAQRAAIALGGGQVEADREDQQRIEEQHHERRIELPARHRERMLDLIAADQRIERSRGDLDVVGIDVALADRPARSSGAGGSSASQPRSFATTSARTGTGRPPCWMPPRCANAAIVARSRSARVAPMPLAISSAIAEHGEHEPDDRAGRQHAPFVTGEEPAPSSTRASSTTPTRPRRSPSPAARPPARRRSTRVATAPSRAAARRNRTAAPSPTDRGRACSRRC